MNCPEVSFAVGSPACLDEAVIQRQIMPDAISPSRSPIAKISVVVQDPLEGETLRDLLKPHASHASYAK